MFLLNKLTISWDAVMRWIVVAFVFCCLLTPELFAEEQGSESDVWASAIIDYVDLLSFTMAQSPDKTKLKTVDDLDEYLGKMRAAAEMTKRENDKLQSRYRKNNNLTIKFPGRNYSLSELLNGSNDIVEKFSEIAAMGPDNLDKIKYASNNTLIMNLIYENTNALLFVTSKLPTKCNIRIYQHIKSVFGKEIEGYSTESYNYEIYYYPAVLLRDFFEKKLTPGFFGIEQKGK